MVIAILLDYFPELNKVCFCTAKLLNAIHIVLNFFIGIGSNHRNNRIDNIINSYRNKHNFRKNGNDKSQIGPH